MLTTSASASVRFAGGKVPAVNLAHLPPPIQAQWDAKANPVKRSVTIQPDSGRIVEWRCTACGSYFKRRVRDHVARNGACPACAATAGERPLRPSVVPQARRSRTQAPTAAELSSDAARRVPGRSESLGGATGFKDFYGRPISPMLAVPWFRYQHQYDAKSRLFVSSKLDGVRAVVPFIPPLGVPVFVSRLGNVFESTDWIAEALRPVFEKDPKLVLDGEIYVHGDAADVAGRGGASAFHDLIGAIRALRETRTVDHEEIQRTLQFHVFDVLYSDAAGITPESPFTKRIAAAERLLAGLNSPLVKLVPHKLIKSSAIHAALDGAVAHGYEGLMVREPGSIYTVGSRSVKLMKAKQVFDDEFTVVGVLEGKGRLKGAVGAIECRADAAPDEPFRVMFGVPDDERRRYWVERRSLIGKRVTVQYQELTPRGVPRFGQFKCVRSDADGSNFV